MRKTTIFIIILFVISAAAAAMSWHVRTGRDQGSRPVITMGEGSVEVPVGADDSEILRDIIANDAEDGDLSQKLVVEGMSRFVSKGRRIATIGVVDSTDKVTEVTREVVYTDYESPKFDLKAPLIFPLGSSKLDGYITAEDMIDGDVSGKIRMQTDATNLGEQEGSFRATFTCSNSLGDSSEIPLTIIYDNNVSDKSFPVLKLTDYIMYMKEGEWVNLWDMFESVTADRKTYEMTIENDRPVFRVPGTEPIEPDETDEEDEEEEEKKDPNLIEWEEIGIIYGGLNYDEAGVYEVYFTYTDKEERTGRTCLVVVVEEAE